MKKTTKNYFKQSKATPKIRLISAKNPILTSASVVLEACRRLNFKTLCSIPINNSLTVQDACSAAGNDRGLEWNIGNIGTFQWTAEAASRFEAEWNAEATNRVERALRGH